MLVTRSFLLLSLSSLLTLALAQSKNPFTSPSSGEKISAGEVTDITWTVDSQYTTIGLSFCRGSGQDCRSIDNVDNSGSYSWTPPSSITPDDSYYLLMTGTSGSLIGTSATFEIQGGAGSSSSSTSASPTTGSSTAGSGPSSTSRVAATTTDGNPSSNSASATPSGESSSSNGGVIGGAIGAVVVVIIVAVAGFIWMRKRNQKKLAEARNRRRLSDDDIEAGNKSNRSSMLGGAAAGGKKPEAYDSKGGYGQSDDIPLAELPAMQQEPVEMAVAPNAIGGSHFFAMELDSREIPRPGTSTVKPDIEETMTKPSMDKGGHARGVSIDGTTVNSESERPRTAGTIEQIKEESREGSAQQSRAETPTPAPETRRMVNTTAAPPSRTGEASRMRDSTPQLRNSIPSLPAFDFDSSKF